MIGQRPVKQTDRHKQEAYDAEHAQRAHYTKHYEAGETS